VGLRCATQTKRQLTPGEIAWLLSVPCALLAVAAMAFLGGPLGNLLLNNGRVTILPEWRPAVFLKSGEQARYLIALAAPVALAATTLILVRRPPRLAPRTVSTLVSASQFAGAAFVAACVWAQHDLVFGASNGYPISEFPHGYTQTYFTARTLLVAGVLATAALLIIKSDSARVRVAVHMKGRGPVVAVAASAVAVLITASWVLAGVNFDSTLGNAAGSTILNVKWPLDETFAVLDGRTPLVNFIPQYGSLWPYATALAMSVFGVTFTVFSLTMCAITASSLLAVFAVLRRVTGNSPFALLLYLPFLATGLFYTESAGVNSYGPIALYALFPLRYAGPYLLVWLAARHIDGARPRQRWLLFLAGGLVILNNTEFGIPAFVATVAALLWIDSPLRWKSAGRLLLAAFAGLLAAYALVSIVTLLRTGSAVRLSALFLFDRIYGLTDWADLPTPALGMHIVVYLTYAAAFSVAAVRAIRREQGRLLTGLLVWSSIYGFGLGAYYMGRSGPEAVVMMFSAWALSLALLAVVAAQQLARGPGRRPTIAHCAVFFGMGVAACSLAQTPMPWAQVKRLESRAAPTAVASPALRRLLVSEGESKPEAIMSVLGHRVAYEAGIVDVSPFSGMLLIITMQQFSETLCELRASGGTLLVLPLANTFREFYVAADEAGFKFIGRSNISFEVEGNKPDGLTLWRAPTIAQQSCRPTGAVT
jgi:hypothetical protein